MASATASKRHTPEALRINPPHGERGDFRKVTVTLPPADYGRLIAESAKRKIAGDINHPLSAIIREALADYLR